MIDQKNIRYFCIVILLSLVSSSEILAQHYPIRTYTEADGLANSMILDLKQDSSGIIWIARRSGISSYDGISFKNYNLSNGLKATSYSFLRIDSKFKLWGLVESGELAFSTFEGNHWKTIICRQGLDSIRNMTYTAFEVCYQNNELVVLVGTDKNGLYKFQNNRWMPYQITNGLPSNRINDILNFGGKVLVATNHGLCEFRNNSIQASDLNIPSDLSKNVLVMSAQGNVLWILGDNWLGFVKDGKFTLLSKEFRLPLKSGWSPSFIQADGLGNVYFGNTFKVYCLKKENGIPKMLTRTNGLISEGGTSALVDREFNTWIGGLRGITKILPRRFVGFYARDGLNSNEVASGLEYSHGRYVFGHDGVLSFYNGVSFSTLTLDPSLQNRNYNSRVLDLSYDFQGNLWAAVSTMGLARIDKNRNIGWYRAAQGLKGIAFSVLSMGDGKLIAGTTTGLYELRGNRFLQVYGRETHGSSIRKIYPGIGNEIFISTISRGIIEVGNNKVITHRSSENELANDVFSFFIDSKKRKWVGTAAGLYILNDTTFIKPGISDFFTGHPIYLILEDKSGRLWFGCDNGIYRWDGKILDHFSTSEGLSGLEINRSAGFIDFKNRIWFGTNNGLTVYDPEADFNQNRIPPPKLNLLSLESGQDTLNPENPQKLPYKNNNLTFHFKAISFIDEKQVVYKYMLEGLDKDWSNETFYLNNSVRYNNLHPGEYRFCVKAKNSLGTWSEPVCSAEISVKPPFWQKRWFIAAVIFLSAVIIYFELRYTFIIRYNARLGKMVSARTADLKRSEQLLNESNQAKDSFFSIIAHDLRSPFNVILGMLDLLTSGYSEYTDQERQKMLLSCKNASARTIDLLENLLTWARVQKGSLPYSPEKFNIADVINENVHLFESAFQSKEIILKQSGEKNISTTSDRNMMNTIVRNLISNAIKFTKPGGSISIHVCYYDDDHLMVTVKDSGIGMSQQTLKSLFKIENRMVMRGTNNERGTGLGLILSKEFIEKNSGKIWVTSVQGAGSTFNFTLPADRSS